MLILCFKRLLKAKLSQHCMLSLKSQVSHWRFASATQATFSSPSVHSCRRLRGRTHSPQQKAKLTWKAQKQCVCFYTRWPLRKASRHPGRALWCKPCQSSLLQLAAATQTCRTSHKTGSPRANTTKMSI